MLVYSAEAGAVTLAADTVLIAEAASGTTVNIADASSLTATAAQLHGLTLVAAEDVLDFSAFLSGGSVALNAGALEVITATTDNADGTAAARH